MYDHLPNFNGSDPFSIIQLNHSIETKQINGLKLKNIMIKN